MRLFKLLLFFFTCSTGFLYSQKEINYSDDFVKKLELLEFPRFYNEVNYLSDFNEVKLKLIQSKDSVLLAKIYNFCGNYFALIENKKLAEKYYDSSLVISKKIKNRQLELQTRIHKNYLRLDLMKNDDFIKEVKQIIKTAEVLNLKKILVLAYNSLGVYYDFQGEQIESLKAYTEGLKIANTISANYEMAILKNNIGLVRMNKGQFKNAKEYFEEAYNLTEAKHYRLRGNILNNLGSMNTELGNLEEAERNFNLLIKTHENSPYKVNYIAAFINLAIIEEKRGNYKKAMEFLDTLSQFSTSTEPNYFLKERYQLFAACAVGLKDIQSLDYYLNKYKEELINEGIFPSREYYSLKANSFELKNKLDSAIFYHKKLHEVTDSLNRLNIDVQLAEIEIMNRNEILNINLEKAESDKLFLQEKVKSIKSRNQTIYISLICLAIIVIFSIYIFYSNKFKKKQQEYTIKLLDSIDQERIRIGADLHDDIGQTLSFLKTRIDLIAKNNEPIDEQLKGDFSQLIQKVRKLSHVLYPSSLTNLGLKGSMNSLMDSVRKHTDLVCTVDVEDIVDDLLDTSQQFNVYRIIQENITNTIKHSKGTALKVVIQVENGSVLVKYMDNGIGMDEKKLDEGGIGLKIIQERLKLLNAKSVIESNQKTGFRMNFKIKIKIK